MANPTNTLAGLTLAQIAQKSLRALLPDLYMLKMFAVDFSDEIADVGGSVTTRFVGRATATDVSTGYLTARANSSSTPVTISLSYNDGYVFGFTDFQVSTIGEAALQRLFMEPARNAVVTAVMGRLLALVTPGNFPNSSVIASPTADAIASFAGACNISYIPKVGRYALFNTPFNTTLTQDPAIQAIYASGSGLALREGQAGRLAKFDTYEYTEVPTANNLVGLAGVPDALCLAARTLVTPPDPSLEVENVTDPDSGLPLQYRKWYDKDNKLTNLSVEALYGVAVGNPGMLRRITSA